MHKVMKGRRRKTWPTSEFQELACLLPWVAGHLI